MSKQSEAKKKQNYNPKPDHNMCSNCIHYKSDFVAGNVAFNKTYYDEKNKTCTLGGFVVKKTATCSDHKFATVQIIR